MGRTALVAPLTLVGLGLLPPVPLAAQESDTTRRCAPALTPRTLPELNAVVDSTALVQSFAQVTVPGTPKEVLLSLGFDSQGRLRKPQVLDRNMSVDSAAIIGKYVTSIVRLQGASAEPWAIRLRIVLAESARFSIERSQFCSARREAPPVTATREVAVVTAEEFAAMVRLSSARVTVRVSEEGIPLTVEIVQSSGSRTFDDSMLESYRRARYKPALLDGVPVESSYEGRWGPARGARVP